LEDEELEEVFTSPFDEYGDNQGSEVRDITFIFQS